MLAGMFSCSARVVVWVRGVGSIAEAILRACLREEEGFGIVYFTAFIVFPTEVWI